MNSDQRPNERSEFINRYADSFLDETGSNAQLLAARMSWILDQLYGKSALRKALRPRATSPLPVGTLPATSAASFETTFNTILPAFDGCIQWNNPGALFNVTPSPMLDVVAVCAATALMNPNAIWEQTAGGFLDLERNTIELLGEMNGWDPTHVGGLFTTGGKSTLLYAIKIGLSRLSPSTAMEGVGRDHIVLAHEGCHFSLESVCNYLGIGSDNCVRVKTTDDGTVSISELLQVLRSLVHHGKKIAAVILHGGSTINFTVDPIAEVIGKLRSATAELRIAMPHIHVDTVISWPWLSFVHHKSDSTLTECSEVVRHDLSEIIERMKQVHLADSFGVDFHKTGLCPYSASCIVVRDKSSLANLNSKPPESRPEVQTQYRFPYEWSIDNSRPCTGIAAGAFILYRLGRAGIQDYLNTMLDARKEFVRQIRSDHFTKFEIVSAKTSGFEIVIYLRFRGITHSFSTLLALQEPFVSEYARLANAFREFIWHDEQAFNLNAPFIGFVANYRRPGAVYSAPAFLLYPVSLHLTPSTIATVLKNLRSALDLFEDQQASSAISDLSRAVEHVVPPPR